MLSRHETLTNKSVVQVQNILGSRSNSSLKFHLPEQKSACPGLSGRGFVVPCASIHLGGFLQSTGRRIVFNNFNSFLEGDRQYLEKIKNSLFWGTNLKYATLFSIKKWY